MYTRMIGSPDYHSIRIICSNPKSTTFKNIKEERVVAAFAENFFKLNNQQIHQINDRLNKCLHVHAGKRCCFILCVGILLQPMDFTFNGI